MLHLRPLGQPSVSVKDYITEKIKSKEIFDTFIRYSSAVVLIRFVFLLCWTKCGVYDKLNQVSEVIITDKFYLGSSYYPEWWDEKRWKEDFSLMASLDFNVVRMGEFAWSWYEPREGEYNFEPMLRALDCAKKHGISVIMATTTAVAPAWLYKKYPEIKGGNIYGHYDFGGRKGQCLSSRIFLEYAEKITARQTEALGSHPAIIGWQLDNEPGFPFNDFDERCTDGFREWLREKYGTIDELNKAWFTMFWSNVYNDFDEICIPVNASEGGWSREVQLDYRKYFSFTFNRLLSMEAGYVRKHSPGRFIYTNWPGANWSVHCFEAESYLDYAAWDNYVPQPFGEDYRIQLRASMEHSFDRRLSHGKNEFLVAEQKAYVDADANPDVIAAQTWLNISHGAFATVYFEWCMPLGGAEQGYGGVINTDRSPRRETKPVFEKLSADIKKIYPLISSAETQSEIAVLYSYENSWGTPGWTVDGFYDEEFFNAYGGFKNALKTNIDVVGIQDDFSRYQYLIIPNCKIMTEEQAEKIRCFVRRGGVAIMSAETATHAESNQSLELLPPGLLRDVCGASVSTRVSAGELKKHTGESAVEFPDGTKCGVTNTVEVIDCEGASPLAFYTSGRLKYKCAVSSNRYGDGYALLFGTDGNDVYWYEALARTVKDRFGIAPLLDADDGIIVSSRKTENSEYIFAVNMKDRPLSIRVGCEMTELLTDKVFSGELTLGAYSTAVLLK